MEAVLIGLGAALLWLGGEGLLRAVVDIGRMAKLSDGAIGLCLLGFAGAAPAVALLAVAARDGMGGLAAGAVLTSAIIELTCVLGLCAIIQPLHAQRRAALRAAMALGVATVFVLSLCLADATQIRGFGFVGLVLILGALIWSLRISGPGPAGRDQSWRVPSGIERASRTALGLVLVFAALGAGALYLGAKLAMGAARELSLQIGEFAPALAMGLLALGLATPRAVALLTKGFSKRGLNLGQVIGQPIYSLMGGFSLIAIVGGQALSSLAPQALALMALAMGAGALWTYGAGLSRRDGLVLVLSGVGYGIWFAAGG